MGYLGNGERAMDSASFSVVLFMQSAEIAKRRKGRLCEVYRGPQTNFGQTLSRIKQFYSAGLTPVGK